MLGVAMMKRSAADDLGDVDAAAERVEAVDLVEIGAALRAGDQRDRGRDAADPDAGREGARAQAR